MKDIERITELLELELGELILEEESKIAVNILDETFRQSKIESIKKAKEQFFIDLSKSDNLSYFISLYLSTCNNILLDKIKNRSLIKNDPNRSGQINGEIVFINFIRNFFTNYISKMAISK